DPCRWPEPPSQMTVVQDSEAFADASFESLHTPLCHAGAEESIGKRRIDDNLWLEAALIYLTVTFTIAAHQIEEYEKIYREEFLPTILAHGFRPVGIWKTVVGRAGEFLEMWEFQDAADFERRWKALADDPAVRNVLLKTGPLVANEE